MLKKSLRQIDNKILGGMYQRYLNKRKNEAQIMRVSSEFNHNFTSFYIKDNSNPISLLCDKYGSDKGSSSNIGHPYAWPPHTYSDYYYQLLSPRRESTKKVFECGLGTNNPNLLSSMGPHGKPGASLRVWRDYFPNAIIYGADIDRNILFEEERIKTFYIDQMDPIAIQKFWSCVSDENFDFMIDDGLHTFDAGATLFLNSIKKLSVSGVYVIEDVTIDDLFKYKDFFKDTDYLVNYVVMSRPNLLIADNNLVVIQKNYHKL